MKDLIVMDLETYQNGEKIIPYCICLNWEEKMYSFYGEEVVFDFFSFIAVNSKVRNIEIYTHNINFDGLIILEYIKNKKLFFEVFTRHLNVYWIKIIYAGVSIRIRCSYKLIPISVSNMGSMLNYAKGIFPYKFISCSTLYYVGELPNPVFFNSPEEYFLFAKDIKIFDAKEQTITYCNKDVMIVYTVLKAISQIIKDQHRTVLQNSFSFSAIAYKIYTKKFDIWDIKNNLNNMFTHNYIKNAYYGGRCEVFGNPVNKMIHHFDFTGMYSQCMQELFPIGKGRFKEKNLNVNDIGFHSVKVKVSDYLPFLPYRSNKLIFPNGEFTGIFWYEELTNAINFDRCTILEHYSSFIYSEVDYVFKEYTQYFTKIREKGLFYKIFGKNMNNGLYGSFALNEEDENYIVCHTEEEIATYQESVEVTKITNFGTSFILAIKSPVRKEYKKRNLAYAAIISCKARIKLNNSLDLVHKSGGELYYTDTDSIFAGFDKNRVGEEMGLVKWDKLFNDGVFIASKFYFLEKLVLKGVKDKNISLDEIKKKFYDNDEKVVFDNQLNFTKKDYVLKQEYLIKKIFLDKYDKRTFSKDKKTTTPITIYPDLNIQ